MAVTTPDTGLGSVGWWRGQITWASDLRTTLIPRWKEHLNAYRDEVSAPVPEAIRVNVDFEKTEQKRHQLFYRVPLLRLRASPRTLRDSQPGVDLTRAVRVFQEVLQYQAGDKGVNTKALMDMVLFDVLCPAGLGACKVGYERFEDGTVPIQVGMEPDPTAPMPPGAVLGLGPAPMRPVFQDVPNLVHERYYTTRISPVDLLIPPDFAGRDYSREAAWLGHQFYLTRHEAKRRGWAVPPEKGAGRGDREDRLIELPDPGSRLDQLFCTELFYYASRVDAAVVHPLKIRRLVFVAGVDRPVVHEDCRDQTWDANGRLVGGLRALPIKVLSLRYLSDYPYQPSDCRISRRQADELSEFRTQMVIHRRTSTPMRWINLERIVDERVKKMVESGVYNRTIPTDGPGDQLMGEIARAAYPRENFEIAAHMMNDVNRQWALGANQSSVKETGSTTATEIAAIERATANRLAGEREIVMGFWISLIETVGQLIQLYADREDVVEIVGPGGDRALEAWDRTKVQGEYLYTIVPDSALRPDASADRDLALNTYNLLANEPTINRKALVRQTVDAFGLDPEGLVQDAPEAKEEKPRVNVSIKGEDLNPLAAQYPIVTGILQSSGLPVGQPEIGSATPGPNPPSSSAPTGAAPVVDRERLRMSEADLVDARAGGLTDVGTR